MAVWRGITALGMVIGLCLVPATEPAGQAVAQQQEQQEQREAEAFRPKPDLGDLDELRFLTEDDYPPFNYLDEEGALTGFNVELAHALCEELVVECDVRAADWAQLVPALENGEADALIASIRENENSLADLDFTDAYYHTPARFAALKESPLAETSPEALAGKRIAVAEGTAHEAFLTDFYPGSELVAFERPAEARQALRAGEADILFGDGVSLMFWLNGTVSQDCCEFRGGAYAESRYFGGGIGIAVPRGDRRMRRILNYALERLRVTGRLEELYLRYFPLDLY